MQLTIEEIKDLAELAGLKVEIFEDCDAEQEFTVEDCPTAGVKDDDGTPRHYAHVAWCSDYPEEGVMPLGAELPKSVLVGTLSAWDTTLDLKQSNF